MISRGPSSQNLQKLAATSAGHQRQPSASIPDLEAGQQLNGLRTFYRCGSKYTKQHILPHFSTSFVDFTHSLEAYTHGSTLAIFRILFAVVLICHMISWSTLFESLKESYVVLHYPSLSFIAPLAPEIGGTLLGFCCISALLLGLGLATRVATLFTFITYSYLVHTCASNYSDDHLLFLHILFVGCFVKWHRWLSIDALCCQSASQRDKAVVPNWHVHLLKLLTLTPYVFSGLAKLRVPWLLYAEPLRSRLHSHGHTEISDSVLPLLIAWTSLLLDFAVPTLLLAGGTWRRWAIGTALAYQACGWAFAESWTQQLLMMASLVLFMEAQQPARYLAAANIKKIRSYAMLVDRIEGFKDKAEDACELQQAVNPPAPPKPRLALGLIAFVAFHLLFPIRHALLYPSSPQWTMEGHYGSWQASTHFRPGWLYIAANETNGRVHELVPAHDPLVNTPQRKWVGQDPHSLLVYLSRVRQLFDVAGQPLASIHAHSCFTLDGRDYRELYRSDANLLDFVGGYGRVGVSGVGRWIHAWQEAPRCQWEAGPEKRFSLLRRSRESYELLHAKAGLRAEIKSDEEGHPLVHVMHRLPDGRTDPAYLWNTTY